MGVAVFYKVRHFPPERPLRALKCEHMENPLPFCLFSLEAAP